MNAWNDYFMNEIYICNFDQMIPKLGDSITAYAYMILFNHIQISLLLNLYIII